MNKFYLCPFKALFHDGGSYQSKSMDWFLYDRDLRHERVKEKHWQKSFGS